MVILLFAKMARDNLLRSHFLVVCIEDGSRKDRRDTCADSLPPLMPETHVCVDSLPPVMSETSVCSDFLQPLQIFSEFVIQGIGHHLAELAIFNIFLSV